MRASTTVVRPSGCPLDRWCEDGSWSVGRAIDPEHRPTDRPKADDVIFSGYELEDALDHANEALEDEVQVLEEEGIDVKVTPFTRQEILPKPRAALPARAVGGRPSQVRRPRRLLGSAAHADPPWPQSGRRRRLHVLGLASGRVETRGFEFEHVLRDIQDAERVGARGAAGDHRHLATLTRSSRTGTCRCRTAASMGAGYG